MKFATHCSQLKWLMAVLVGVTVGLCCAVSSGQGIHVQTPFNRVSDSYYENFGVSFGMNFANGTGNGSRIVGIFPNGQINPRGIVFGPNSA